MSDYPEHEKLTQVSEKSQACGEFLDWLRQEKGVTLCRYMESREEGLPYIDHKTGQPTKERDWLKNKDNPEYSYWQEGFYCANESTQSLLSEFFGIDLKKLDDEKKAMLDALGGHASE